MARKLRRLAIVVLVNAAVLPLILEGGLRLTDPWRARPWYDDTAKLTLAMQADEWRGYAPAPGHYVFSNWQTTILPGGTRDVPDTNLTAPCTVVLAGDSVTFSFGVNDADTWANLMARALSDVHIINPANNGYNANDALSIVEHFRADVYLYFYISNDDQPPHDSRAEAERAAQAEPSMIRLYLYLYQSERGTSDPYVPDLTFYPALDALAANPKVVMVGQSSQQRADLARYPIRWIAPYTQFISYVDPHANVAGNREIASALLPIVKDAVRERCTAVI
jgi:hypothetical protein